jgi:hypothetical protein
MRLSGNRRCDTANPGIGSFAMINESYLKDKVEPSIRPLLQNMVNERPDNVREWLISQLEAKKCPHALSEITPAFLSFVMGNKVCCLYTCIHILFFTHGGTGVCVLRLNPLR